MSSSAYRLAQPPKEPRELELWLQHAAGFILFQDMREYAMQRVDPGLSADALAAVETGIDDAVYGMMMILDGVTGGLSNQAQCLSVSAKVELTDRASQDVLHEIQLADGDGMCMGYHRWRDGDFGAIPIVGPQ
jgi:hypothetical protein